VTVRITVTRRFEAALKGLPPERAKRASTALVLFMEEPRLPRLNFRALSGSPGHFIVNAVAGIESSFARRAKTTLPQSMSGLTTTFIAAGAAGNAASVQH
jgi:hypothetical protein